MRDNLRLTVSVPIQEQDVQMASCWDRARNKQTSILKYQNQAFRLINAFPTSQLEEVRFMWWNLTDTLGKTCLLLNSPKGCSLWERVEPEQMSNYQVVEIETGESQAEVIPLALAKASLLLLQAVYADVDYVLGFEYADRLQQGIGTVLQQEKFPQATSATEIKRLFQVEPLIIAQTLPWQEIHLNMLLLQLYRMAEAFFGNDNFVARVSECLDDLSPRERSEFFDWLKDQSAIHSLWRLDR